MSLYECLWLYVLCASVEFCKLCIFIVTFMYSYCYVYVFLLLCMFRSVPCDTWVPVTTAWRVLRLWMEERPPIWRVAANKLNKQSRTADEGWSSSLGVGRDVNNTSP